VAVSNSSSAAAAVITPKEFLDHWQSHRRLTRRMIEAFPEEELFSFSIGSMRTFGALAVELLSMAEPMVRGVATGEWTEMDRSGVTTKAEVLRRWDESTRNMEDLWDRIPAEKFHERMTAFGQYEGPTYELLLYVVDNEIHHRGQGYVYLRALGVEPPPFWERI
jgi:uncharacterized damage-inducible protein DinB